MKTQWCYNLAKHSINSKDKIKLGKKIYINAICQKKCPIDALKLSSLTAFQTH